MQKILFVCTGNTCRSPMAEAIFNHVVQNRYEAKSAGVLAQKGRMASPHSIEIMRSQSIPLNHMSTQLDKELIEWADLILTMANSHKQAIQQNFPEAEGKVFGLKEYAQNSQIDIMDPFGGTLEDYHEIYIEIEESIQLLIKKLDNK